MRSPRWPSIVLVALLTSTALWLFLASAPAAAPVRRAAIGALLLLNILTSYLTDSRFEIAALLTLRPHTEERTLSFQQEPLRLTLFYPGGKDVRGGLLLVNGAVERGNDEPAIRRVAISFARLGFLVALPDLASLRAYRLDHDDPGRLTVAFAALRSDPVVTGKPIGLVGFCFGASLGLLAASDPAVAGDVAFVAGAIPYARLDTLIVDVLSHSAVGTAGVRPWEPRDDVQAKLPLALIGLLGDEKDHEALRDLLEHNALQTGQADLSPAAEALRRLLLARDRQEAEGLLAKQDPALLAALRDLSPLPQLDGLRAPLFLFHSANDRVIPWEHSAALVEAAPSGGRLEVSTLLQHTRLVLDPSQWRLLLTYPRAAWELLLWLDQVLAAAGVR